MFGCAREHVKVDAGLVPMEVTWANKILPKHYGEHLVAESAVDSAALAVWKIFQEQIELALKENRVIFLEELRGEPHFGYPDFCDRAIAMGDQCFWRGEWVLAV